MGVISITMGSSVICMSFIMSVASLVLPNEDQERQLSNIGTNPLGTLLGLGGSGLSAGALAALAENNPALAALLGSGLNGLPGTGFAGAGALLGSGLNGPVDPALAEANAAYSLLGLLSGGNRGKGGKGGKGGVSGLFSSGKGGKGKHGRMLERQLISNIGTNPLGTLHGLGGSGLSAGALAALAGNNPALAALLGSGLNGLTGTGFAGAGALLGSGLNGPVDPALAEANAAYSLLGLLSGGNRGKGGKGGKGGVSGLFSSGKGGKGKHGRMLERQLISNIGTNPLGTLHGLGGS